MEKNRKDFVEEGLKTKKEKERKFNEKEEFYAEGWKGRPPKDTMTTWIRIQKSWHAELLRIGAEWTLRDQSDERKTPWTVPELIRYAIAKTFFLRPGEPVKKFMNDWTSFSKRFI